MEALNSLWCSWNAVDRQGRMISIPGALDNLLASSTHSYILRASETSMQHGEV